MRTNTRFASLAALSLAALALFAARPVLAGTSSASVTETQLTPTTFQYSITLNNSAASSAPIGTFWLAWLPGQDFLATTPLSVSSPAGWTDNLFPAGGGNGASIQWLSSSPAASLPVGKSLSGFTFTSTDTPATVFGNSVFYPGTPALTSTIYSGGPFSDAGQVFVASASTSQAVPLPPAAWSGLLMLAGLLGVSGFRRRMV